MRIFKLKHQLINQNLCSTYSDSNH